MKVALVAIVKEESNLLEWCNYHLALGFDKIYLYCNDWLPDYKLPDEVALIQFPGQGVQMAAYHDWQKRFEKFYVAAMFLDADEFLYLVKWSDVKQLIQQIGYSQSITINWVFFGSKEEPYQFNTVVGRFMHRDNKPDKHIKTILRLHAGNYMINPHHGKHPAVSPEHKAVIGPYNEYGIMDNAFVAHYYYQTPEYWAKKVGRGRADSAKMNRATERYKEFDFDKVFDSRINYLYKHQTR